LSKVFFIVDHRRGEAVGAPPQPWMPAVEAELEGRERKEEYGQQKRYDRIPL
jgi:hypothetical protein